MRASSELLDPDAVLWDAPPLEAHGGPSGAAAGMAVVAFVAFVIGLAVASLLML